MEEDDSPIVRVDLTEIVQKLDILHERLKNLETQTPSSLTVGDVSLTSNCGLSQLKEVSVSLLQNKSIKDYLNGTAFNKKKIFRSGLSFVGGE